MCTIIFIVKIVFHEYNVTAYNMTRLLRQGSLVYDGWLIIEEVEWSHLPLLQVFHRQKRFNFSSHTKLLTWWTTALTWRLSESVQRSTVLQHPTSHRRIGVAETCRWLQAEKELPVACMTLITVLCVSNFNDELNLVLIALFYVFWPDKTYVWMWYFTFLFPIVCCTVQPQIFLRCPTMMITCMFCWCKRNTWQT